MVVLQEKPSFEALVYTTNRLVAASCAMAFAELPIDWSLLDDPRMVAESAASGRYDFLLVDLDSPLGTTLLTLAEVDHRQIVLFGKMRELALYRAEVLQRMGYQVIVPKSYAEAVRAVDDGGFHVAILSYTLSSEVVKELADLIRQRYPGCPLVTIAQHARSDAEIQPDAIVLSELGPTGLVEALDRLRTKRLQ